MKRVQKVLIILVIGALVGVSIAYYMYNKPHQNIDEASPDFKVEATELYKSFEENDNLASINFNGKIVEVSGIIDKINSQDTAATILLAIENVPTGSIKCGMDRSYLDRMKNYEAGKEVTIKGKFSGVNKLDELGITMLDIELTRCVVVE